MLDLGIDIVVPSNPLFNGTGSSVVQEELLAATKYGVNVALGEILPATPVGVSGMLRGGVQSDVRANGAVGVDARIFDPINYALPVDQGARPHMPPSSALVPWVIRKLGASEQRAKGIAFAIALKIKASGTEAKRFFSDPWARVKPRVQARFDQALARITERLGGR